MIGSVAFMLEKGFKLEEESWEIWHALSGVLSSGYTTKELATPGTLADKIVSTRTFGDMVVSYVHNKK
jgi:hypothetical protein